MRKEKIAVYEQRVRMFIKRLGGEVLGEVRPLHAEICVTGKSVPFSERLRGDYTPIEQGEKWGALWDYAWLHITGAVPAEWTGRDVAAKLEVGTETTVFDARGCPVCGLTRGSVFNPAYSKNILPLFTTCRGDEQVDIWVEAASSHWMGATRGEIIHLDLHVLHTDVWQLLLDMETLLSLMDYMPASHPRRARVLRGLSQAVDRYRDDPAQAAASRRILQPLLAAPANASDLTATSVGHAHIDTGWLWPVTTTVGKVIRTFASQVSLIDQYPDYIFGASQPQHYAFVKERAPQLYEKIRRYVAEGRWEPQGGMWVEADCNLIDGESMVRQFLYGKNFFKDEFGVDVRNLWLPDVFGYSAAMPQILRKAGVDFFLTQKISWSQFNKFPHNTFLWRGIDGSDVLTHFPPEDNYNSELLPHSLGAAQDRFKENAFLDEFLCLFGMGDGGGGPKAETIEHGLRAQSLEGSPKVRFGRADAFFDRMAQHRDQLERWVGELYLELHRGTLTTQALAKKRNRRIEQQLRHVEFLCASLPASEWPRHDLDAIWKKLLINQFHDILPGSSVPEVYEVTHAEYESCLERCDALIRQAASTLIDPDPDAVTLFNSLSVDYTVPTPLPPDWRGHDVEDVSGHRLPVQDEPDGLVVLAPVPAQGFTTLTRVARSGAAPTTDNPEANGKTFVLENGLIRYEINRDGQVLTTFDKEADRELMADGHPGNVLSLYEDRPNNWEAWDIDCFYEDQRLEQAVSTDTPLPGGGPVRSELTIALRIGRSALVQHIRLCNNSKRLDFVTHIDWREQRRMLRVAFPTTVRAEQASFDIQYGYVRRNTHRSSNWDMARFEVAAHRYVDLSDHDYGVALLNDCKYGHKVVGNVLDLNLLRSPHFPDEPRDCGFTDQGPHTFTYSLLPHAGTLIESTVMAEAAMLNRPPALLHGRAGAAAAIPVTLQAGGLSMEALKRAEKGDDLIIRIVETLGRTSSGTLRINGGPANLIETNLMEWSEASVQNVDREVAITLQPFEIRTYKLSR